MVILLHLALLLERLFPTRLQRACHESVLGLHGVILPLGSRDILPRAFQGLAPLVVELPALSLGALEGAQAEVQCSGLERAEHFPRDQVVQRRRRDMPAGLVQGSTRMLAAVIARSLVRLVSRHHPT